jgi:NADPH:quinone reductase-like Zn-dependent oxidoreductase
MRAITQSTYGSSDVLELSELERPTPGEHDVLVRIHAAGVDRGVWHLMTGLPYPTRLAFGFSRPASPVPGMDLAGTVCAVGAAVTRFRPGDEVFGIGRGTYAEYALAAEDKLALKPRRLTFAQAAVLAVTGSTAAQAVLDHGQVKAGTRLLVLGASGGVGSYTVQLARSVGAEVTGVASGPKLELVRDLGADRTIDYRKQDPLAEAGRYDVILDCGGNASLGRLRAALQPQGTLVIVGGEGGGRWLGGLDRQLRAVVLNAFTTQQLKTFVAVESAQELERLVRLVEEGAITPVVDRTFPLEQAADALRLLEGGHVRGKLAIAVKAITQTERLAEPGVAA